LGAATMGRRSVEGDKNGSYGDNTGAKRTLEKGSYDYQSFHTVHNIVRMLTFTTSFAIVNCALIAQFDNYGTSYHREKQQ
jgi:hypothetical protein